jgi:tetratricopeptide (TPR) repeat protein
MKRPARRRQQDQPRSPAVPVPPARSVAAGGDISGIGSTGDYATNVQYRAERMTVLPAEAFRPWAELGVPPGMRNLPAPPGRFVGRAEELARLDAALAGPGEVVVQAVHGLGGIGKSTLAAHWAAVHAGDYTLTWWITAGTPAAIDAGLASLAAALQPALSGALPLEALREGAVQWLAAHQGWLLVLDNATGPADIAPLLARAPGGRYLITSRRATGWHATAAPVRLDVLDQAEAAGLLTAILTHDRPRDLDGAGELCTELGCLPLAIEQAGAYLAQAGVTPREYLDLLASYPAAMYQAGAEGGDAARTIARIWHVTLDRLADDPLTGQVLRILAWYAPDNIPRTLLDGLADPPALQGAVGRLAAYSMLTADAGTLAMHRLVQAVTRTPDPDDPHRRPQAVDDARDQATRQLADAVPDWQDPAQWPAWRMLLPHIDALASHAPPDTDTEETAYLLNQAGMFLEYQGQVARAAGHLHRAFADRQRVLGEDHPDTLASRNNLGGAYRSAGDLGRAIPLAEQTLADCVRLLGEDHPSTLASGNNLAYAYASAGDLGRAVPLYEQALADRQRVLGEDHPDTLISRNSLAGAYESAGDLGRAIPLYEQALAGSVRVLGEDHPDTLTSRGNLASAYRSAGDLGRAVSLAEQALADRQRVLGEDHPDTLASRNNLAYAYASAGDLGRAVPLYEQALAGSERVLGEDHPQTLISRGNLAGAYESVGDLGRAIALHEQALADQQRVLGEDHPHTLISRNNLAAAYRSAGDLGRAVPLYEQTLADRQRVLGEDHPDTLISRNNLVGAYESAGDLGRAIALHEQTLADRQRVLGEDHPHTLISRGNLAAAYRSAGDLGRAISLYEQALADQQRVLGEDHPETLISGNNLAAAYESAGDLGRAVPLYEQALAGSVRVLGEDHPQTKIVRSNLATALPMHPRAERNRPAAKALGWLSRRR